MALSIKPDMLASMMPRLRDDAKWHCCGSYYNGSMYECITTSYGWLTAIQDFTIVVLSCTCTVALNQVARPKIFKRMRPGNTEIILIEDIMGPYFH